MGDWLLRCRLWVKRSVASPPALGTRTVAHINTLTVTPTLTLTATLALIHTLTLTATPTATLPHPPTHPLTLPPFTTPPSSPGSPASTSWWRSSRCWAPRRARRSAP